jgi:hypothetical protein
MFALTARYGISTPLCKTQVVKREMPWAADLEWTVEIVPLWPVSKRWSKSKASPPRISPRMIRSANFCFLRTHCGKFEPMLLKQLQTLEAIVCFADWRLRRMKYATPLISNSGRKENLKFEQSRFVGVANDPSHQKRFRSVSEMRVAPQGREQRHRGERKRDWEAPAIASPAACGGVPSAVFRRGVFLQFRCRRSKVFPQLLHSPIPGRASAQCDRHGACHRPIWCPRNLP